MDAEGIPEGLPFLLDLDGRYDIELNRYFQRAQILAGPENTQRAIAYDLRSWLSFLWSNRGGKNWRDATGEDRAAYQYWRRKDPAGPHVEGSTWDREVATANRFYRWAVDHGLVQTNPIEQRPWRRRRDWGVEEGQTPAERSHDARRGRIAWLTPTAYRQWRDVGIRGYRPDGLADQAFRGRHAARNTAFCDLMLRTGLRLSEQVSLSWLELPTLAEERVYRRFLLPRAIAKWGSGRAVYVPASALRAVWDYVRFERAAAVEQARVEGRYEQLEGAMVVEDPARPAVRMARVRRPVPIAGLTRKSGLGCWCARRRGWSRQRCGWMSAACRSAPGHGSRRSATPTRAAGAAAWRSGATRTCCATRSRSSPWSSSSAATCATLSR